MSKKVPKFHFITLQKLYFKKNPPISIYLAGGLHLQAGNHENCVMADKIHPITGGRHVCCMNIETGEHKACLCCGYIEHGEHSIYSHLKYIK